MIFTKAHQAYTLRNCKGVYPMHKMYSKPQMKWMPNEKLSKIQKDLKQFTSAPLSDREAVVRHSPAARSTRMLVRAHTESRRSERSISRRWSPERLWKREQGEEEDIESGGTRGRRRRVLLKKEHTSGLYWLLPKVGVKFHWQKKRPFTHFTVGATQALTNTPTHTTNIIKQTQTTTHMTQALKENREQWGSNLCKRSAQNSWFLPIYLTLPLSHIQYVNDAYYTDYRPYHTHAHAGETPLTSHRWQR